MLKTLQVIAFMAISSHAFCTNNVPEFTAVYDGRKNAVRIKWQNKVPEIKTFIIQRSADDMNWVDIALQPVNSNTINKPFQFEDDKPGEGENYYRLKCNDANDEAKFTSSVRVIAAPSTYNWLMYPVPLSDVLTLEYKGSEMIRGVITVLIQSISGRVFTRIRSSSLCTLIKVPVGNLGAGIWDVKIVVEDEIIWNQRLVK